MIDTLQRIARAIQILRLPSIAVGFISLASIVVILFTSGSHEGDRFLIPSFVGLLWAISTYTFVGTFRSVPERANKSQNFIARIGRNMIRGWYWLIGVVFLGTTAAVIFITYRMVSIWFRDYGG